jgi:hypothetical protein
MINKGIVWAYFESGEKGILVINFDLYNIYTIKQSFQQVINLEKSLRFENIKDYEIYVTFNDFYKCSDNDVIFFDDNFVFINNETVTTQGLHKKIFYKKIKFDDDCFVTVSNNYNWTIYRDNNLICVNKNDIELKTVKENTIEPQQEVTHPTPPSATPPSASPPSASPPSATPPSATPPSATPRSASPRSASPQSASPPSATPPSASPTSASPTSASPRSASPRSASPRSASPRSASPSAVDIQLNFDCDIENAIDDYFHNKEEDSDDWNII